MAILNELSKVGRSGVVFRVIEGNQEVPKHASRIQTSEYDKRNRGSSKAINWEVATDLDDSKILEKYIDKVDQDRRDQEERIASSISHMEKRITEERRLSEERMEKRFNETMNVMRETNSQINKLEEKLDNKTEKMIEKIDSSNKWIIGICISTIIGIAAMIVTLLIFFLQIKATP